MRIVELSQLDPASIPSAEIPAAIAILAALSGALAARMLAAPMPAPAGANDESDTMLTTEEAAQLLRRSPKWIYRNAKRLSFVKRLSARSMVHSKRGIERYLATRKA
jgi:hypothetical protein